MNAPLTFGTSPGKLNQSVLLVVQAFNNLTLKLQQGFDNPRPLPVYTVAALTALTTAPTGSMAYCVDEVGGGVPAFWDSVNWRRVTDRAIVS